MEYNQCPVCNGANIQMVNGYTISENGGKSKQLKIECFDCKFSIIEPGNFHVSDESLEKYTNSDQTKYDWNKAIHYITIQND